MLSGILYIQMVFLQCELFDVSSNHISEKMILSIQNTQMVFLQCEFCDAVVNYFSS